MHPLQSANGMLKTRKAVACTWNWNNRNVRCFHHVFAKHFLACQAWSKHKKSQQLVHIVEETPTQQNLQPPPLQNVAQNKKRVYQFFKFSIHLHCFDFP